MTGGLDTSIDPTQRPGRLGVGVIGAGKVGAVLGAALRNAGVLSEKVLESTYTGNRIST